jgi:pyridinium-3,5-biscarboxylic acid mononucleotide sulfurtransferase
LCKRGSPKRACGLPYGTEVTLGTLTRVARAEEALHGLGFRELRVRHYGDLARIELVVADLDRAFANRSEVVRVVKAAGYRYVTIDLEGFRSGNLNAGLDA